MSGSRSDLTAPLRPDDHADSNGSDPVQPRLGPVGWLRFVWRQLTSMRTALILLLMLALAAVPGSLVPQRSADPNGVVQYERDNPDAFRVLDGLQAFDTYTSFWFSAIYLLLFVSLIGCIIPRTAHHLRALRARPPATPARLGRLVGYRSATASTDPETAIAEAERMLRAARYRVQRYDAPGRPTVSAERGYLRESGNLVFHASLVGVLVAVGIGGGFAYTGQKVIVQDSTFTNVLNGYDSFNPGRFFTEAALDPYSLRLDEFEAEYDIDPRTGAPQPLDFTASVSTRLPGGEWTPAQIKVNEPLSIGGTDVYLLGNGYAPQLTIRNADGEVVDETSTPFLPQDAQLSSLGVVKIPDGLPEQVGMIGFFYPQPGQLPSGAFASLYPEAGPESLLTFRVFAGDLGLDAGVPTNVYALDTDGLTPVAGGDAEAPSLELRPGDRVDLPDGLGSIEFTGYERFVSLDIHHDGSGVWVLGFALAAVAGLLTSLFVPRRRVWVAASPARTGAGEGDAGGGASGCRVEYAGLARGDDPRLEDAVRDLADRHLAEIGGPAPPARPGADVGPDGPRSHDADPAAPRSPRVESGP